MDNEITGQTGTHTTAMFWEYDMRLGRRWNLDPKPTVGVSIYACFGNNPILYSDVYGDTLRFGKYERFMFKVQTIMRFAVLYAFSKKDRKNINYLMKNDKVNYLMEGSEDRGFNGAGSESLSQYKNDNLPPFPDRVLAPIYPDGATPEEKAKLDAGYKAALEKANWDPYAKYYEGQKSLPCCNGTGEGAYIFLNFTRPIRRMIKEEAEKNNHKTNMLIVSSHELFIATQISMGTVNPTYSIDSDGINRMPQNEIDAKDSENATVRALMRTNLFNLSERFIHY
jgi:hypothetical protein